MSQHKSFPFTRLSNEIALEIIRLAATPEGPLVTPNYIHARPNYSTAASLTRVSLPIRNAAFPFLLRSVVLTCPRHLAAFLLFVNIQHRRSRHDRLCVNLHELIHRLHISGVYDHPPMDVYTPGLPVFDLRTLLLTISAVPHLSLSFDAINVLSSALEILDPLSSPAFPPLDLDLDPSAPWPSWRCTSLELSGVNWRWRLLSSNAPGCAFLAHIERLVLWIPDNLTHEEIASGETQVEAMEVPLGLKDVPTWASSTPFSTLRRLQALALPRVTTARKALALVDGVDYSPSTHRFVLVKVPREMLVFRRNVSTAGSESHGGMDIMHAVQRMVDAPTVVKVDLELFKHPESRGDYFKVVDWTRVFWQGQAQQLF